MSPHLSAAILHTSATVLPLAVVVVVPLVWLTLDRAERSALTYRAVVAVGLAVGLASLVGRLPLALSTYAAVAAALLVPLRRRTGAGLLLAAVLGALARGDVDVHQRPVLLAGLVVGVLAAVVGTVVWQQLDPLPSVRQAGQARQDRTARAPRPAWLQLFAPSPVDLDDLDAIIDGPPALGAPADLDDVRDLDSRRAHRPQSSTSRSPRTGVA